MFHRQFPPFDCHYLFIYLFIVVSSLLPCCSHTHCDLTSKTFSLTNIKKDISSARKRDISELSVVEGFHCREEEEGCVLSIIDMSEYDSTVLDKTR